MKQPNGNPDPYKDNPNAYSSHYEDDDLEKDQRSTNMTPFMFNEHLGEGTSTRLVTKYDDEDDANKVLGMNGRDLVKSFVGKPTYMGK